MIDFDQDTDEAEDGSIAMIDLYKLNGETVQIEDRVRPNVSLQYLWVTRLRGVAEAEAWLVERVIGSESYAKLIDYDRLKGEQWAQVVAAVRSVVLGEQRPKSLTEKSTPTRPKKATTPTKRTAGSSTRKPRSRATSAASTE